MKHSRWRRAADEETAAEKHDRAHGRSGPKMVNKGYQGNERTLKKERHAGIDDARATTWETRDVGNETNRERSE